MSLLYINTESCVVAQQHQPRFQDPVAAHVYLDLDILKPGYTLHDPV